MGPYALRKCKANVRRFEELYEERIENRTQNRSLDSSIKTETTTNSQGRLTYRAQYLHIDFVKKWLPMFDHVVRFDVPSFYSRHKKWKAQF